MAPFWPNKAVFSSRPASAACAGPVSRTWGRCVPAARTATGYGRADESLPGLPTRPRPDRTTAIAVSKITPKRLNVNTS